MSGLTRNGTNENGTTKGDVMGKQARIGLLLGASACLLAVMVDWVIEELVEHEPALQGR